MARRPFRTTAASWSLAGLLALWIPTPGVGETPSSTAPGSVAERWLGRDGQPLPFRSDEEMVKFLQQATVTRLRQISGGSTRPWKVLLRRGGVEAHGIFRTVDVRRDQVMIDGERYRQFHDSHRYECAAYGLGRLLGMTLIPPCVEREIRGQSGTLQLWIENAMTDRDRRERNLGPPQSVNWMRDKQTLKLFDALIANIDRNQGNLLIDARERLWLIDHTRSFGLRHQVEAVERIVWCERRLWARLRSLDQRSLEDRLGSLLEPQQIGALLARRSVIVEHLAQRMAELGEGAVLFEADRPQPDLVEIEAGEDDDLPVETTPIHR